jgi:hypothetical protein
MGALWDSLEPHYVAGNEMMTAVPDLAVKQNKRDSKVSPITKEVVAPSNVPPAVERIDARSPMALHPSMTAAAVLMDYSQAFGNQDIVHLVKALSAGMEALWAGDMTRAEGMLYAQAHALQAMFMRLATLAAKQNDLRQCEAYTRMSLKAQNQCRMTLETLATVKNPPAVFARQANINNGGQQQVNNGPPPKQNPTRPRAKRIQ